LQTPLHRFGTATRQYQLYWPQAIEAEMISF